MQKLENFYILFLLNKTATDANHRWADKNCPFIQMSKERKFDILNILEFSNAISPKLKCRIFLNIKNIQIMDWKRSNKVTISTFANTYITKYAEETIRFQNSL